jgi:hypothetical protein
MAGGNTGVRGRGSEGAGGGGAEGDQQDVLRQDPRLTRRNFVETYLGGSWKTWEGPGVV